MTARRAAKHEQAARRIRFTLDLTPEQHRFLKRFAFDAETDASVVMRALLALLQNDERLARRILAEVDGSN